MRRIRSIRYTIYRRSSDSTGRSRILGISAKPRCAICSIRSDGRTRSSATSATTSRITWCGRETADRAVWADSPKCSAGSSRSVTKKASSAPGGVTHWSVSSATSESAVEKGIGYRSRGLHRLACRPPAFLQEGYEVVGIDDLSGGDIGNVPPQVEFLQMRSAPQVGREIHSRGAAARFCIWPVSRPGEISFDDPVADLEKNTVSTLNLIRYGIENRVERIVYASSMSVYGQWRMLPVGERRLRSAFVLRRGQAGSRELPARLRKQAAVCRAAHVQRLRARPEHDEPAPGDGQHLSGAGAGERIHRGQGAASSVSATSSISTTWSKRGGAPRVAGGIGPDT